ncbi:MAG: Retaining alpha-galactosidase precursor [Bacteroidetes bacterium ADurb.Bin416]|jgi:hypothetical protein|nr:MAG: Retaining alpha-galactosidase precursor [Bacteroidetes bacterium ADurb.Bin416]
MKHYYVLVLLLVGFLLPVRAQVPVYGEYKSPDKKVVLKVYQEEARFFFQVYRDKQLLLDKSPLGIETSEGSFYNDLAVRSRIKNKSGREKYTLVVGKQSQIKKKYREITFPLVNLQGKEMDLVFRVMNDGVAYRYAFPGKGSCTVFKEHGGFRLPAGAKGYMTPLSKPKTGFAGTNPSYEEHYVLDVPVGTASPIGVGWTFPALFEVPGSGWLLVSETGVDGSFCGAHLAELSTGGLYVLEYPSMDEGLYSQSPYPTMVLPNATPWRMVVVGADPNRVAETTMATDLVEPLYKPKFDVKPGKATWSWLVLKDDSVTYDVSRRFVDMADHLDFEYCLIDAPWDVQIGRDGIEKLAAYAQSRGVSLLLWYNSNGNWNEAPQTPRDRMNTPAARKEEMKWMQKIGIKGIKVDFFGGDKQFYMQYYQDILTDANEYGLTVNFHGTTLPRGWERMYPNFVTNEAVKGMEFITFEQGNADLQPSHCTVLPYTRNVVGSMDFTPLILNAKLGSDRVSGPVRLTTAAFELALPVVFQSGIQHVGLVPENILQYPFFVTDYLRKLPGSWDETYFLSGAPGRDVVVARRSGETWFVAGINGENREKLLSIDLKGLIKAGKEGCVLVDKVGTPNMVDKLDVVAPKKRRTLDLMIPAYGGFVAVF